MQENNVSIPNEAQRALKKFEDQARAIIKEDFKSLEKSSVPPVIYHYTTDVGLRGILESGNVWLTDMFSLNDPSELLYGYSTAARILTEKAKAKGGEFETAFADQFEDGIKEKFQNSAHYFCCSFSEAGDDLGQWRAYANDGKGYALGFDGKVLEEKFSEIPNPASFPVSYDKDYLYSVQQKTVEKFFPLMAGRGSMGFQKKEELAKYWQLLHMALAKQAIQVTLYFKHHAYSNEKEYRFLKIQNIHDLGGIMYRPRNHKLIKYREFDWRSAGTGVLKKIVIGPAADKEKSSKFVERCLHDSGCNDVEIVCSDIPYKPR